MSVSANVFSVCRSQLHGARILSLPVPVRSRSRPVSHASDTLAALAQRILPEFSVSSAAEFFVHVLLESRYRTLSLRTHGENGAIDPSDLGPPREQVNVDEDLLKMICDCISTARQELLSATDGVDGTHSNFPWNGYRDIIAAHLMESWALQLSGNPSLVHPTLEETAHLLLQMK